jgi:hypothetical protein
MRIKNVGHSKLSDRLIHFVAQSAGQRTIVRQEAQ